MARIHLTISLLSSYLLTLTGGKIHTTATESHQKIKKKSKKTLNKSKQSHNPNKAIVEQKAIQDNIQEIKNFNEKAKGLYKYVYKYNHIIIIYIYTYIDPYTFVPI